MKLTDDMRAAIAEELDISVEQLTIGAEDAFRVGYRMGQQAMRERAAKVCTKHDTGDMQREDMEARRIADAIRSLPVEE